VAEVVPFQHEDLHPAPKQIAFQRAGDGGLAGCGQAGQPDDSAAVAVAPGSLRDRDVAM
jgi:hypothetical protein